MWEDERATAQFIIDERLSPTFRVMPPYMWNIKPLTDEDLVWLLTQRFLADSVAFNEAKDLVRDHKKSLMYRKVHVLGYR